MLVFFAEHLNRTVFYNAIIPKSDEPLKTLYLLHGWSGNCDDWIKHGNIVKLAENYQIAVILPNGENSFYVDFSEAESYGKMVAEDLVVETRRVFKLSSRREDTWIAGLSMGGYGALKLGLSYPDTFSKITGMSSRIIAKGLDELDYEDPSKLPPTLRNVLIRLTADQIEEKMNLCTLVNKCPALPQIDLYCGSEDEFYPINVKFHQWLKERQPSTHLSIASGEHDWAYWNHIIEQVIERLIR